MSERDCCKYPHLNDECDGSCFTNERVTHPTPEHMKDLWDTIERMSERLLDEPENRTLAIMLSASVDNYNAKLKLTKEGGDNQPLSYR